MSALGTEELSVMAVKLMLACELHVRCSTAAEVRHWVTNKAAKDLLG